MVCNGYHISVYCRYKYRCIYSRYCITVYIITVLLYLHSTVYSITVYSNTFYNFLKLYIKKGVIFKKISSAVKLSEAKYISV